jgi:uncharacterized protein YndB with AHSA1/START domain
MKNSQFIIERVLNAPVSKVWRAITNKEDMKKWYFDLSEFKPEVGFEFSFPGQGHQGEKYIHHCQVTEVVKEKKLVYSWAYEGFPGISYVHFELFAEGDHTRIRLTHEGLETFPQNNSDFARESFAAGWTELIGALLKNFVEKP